MLAIQAAEAADNASGGASAGLSEIEWAALEEKHKPIAARHLFADRPWICRRQWQVAVNRNQDTEDHVRLELLGDAFVEEPVRLQLDSGVSVLETKTAKGHVDRCYCDSPIVKVVSSNTAKVCNGKATLSIPVTSSFEQSVMFQRVDSSSEWKQRGAT